MKALLCWLALSLGLLRAEGTTAVDLFAAALRNGDTAAMETLLSAGFDPNLPDRHGQTPLCLALLLRQPVAVKLLLAHHVDPNGPLDNSPFPARPLSYALENGNLLGAAILVRAGAKVDAKGPGGRTAMHAAVVGRQLDALQFLIEQGADVNARDAEGVSPLDDAVWRGSLNTAAILLAHGAPLNEPEPRTGATPVNEAAFRGHTAVLRYLLQFHPDLSLADKRGYSPLENAMRMGKEDCAVLLLGAEPKERQTPLYLTKTMDTAILKNQPLLVRALLEDGAPLDASGPEGATPLEEASLRGFDAIVGVLLDKGAPVDGMHGASGTTALYAAASFGKTGAVKALLDRGANPNLCGKNRKTPYQAAMDNGYAEVAAQIRERGGAAACAR